MAKKESLVKLSISLFLITVIAAIGLAAIYSITKTPIEKSQSAKKEMAISSVLPKFKGDLQQVSIMPESGKDSVIVYLAYDGDKLFGGAVETYTDKAFSGTFSLMVGFDSIGNILGTEVLKMAETPGLGDKIDKSKSPFATQFVGKNPASFKLKVTKDGGDVEAITAATISSRAFCDAVDRAHSSFLKAKKEANHE